MKTSITSTLILVALIGFAAGSVFADPLSAKQEAAIQQEVTRAYAEFVLACERVDLAGALRAYPGTPDFHHAVMDGAIAEFPRFREILADFLASCTAQKAFTKRQEVYVTGPDTALLVWSGALEIIWKNRPVQRLEPYSVTFLFRRIGGEWKIVFQHESSSQL